MFFIVFFRSSNSKKLDHFAEVELEFELEKVIFANSKVNSNKMSELKFASSGVLQSFNFYYVFVFTLPVFNGWINLLWLINC